MRYHIYGCSVRNGNSKAIATVKCKIITPDLVSSRSRLKKDMYERFNTDPLNIDVRYIIRDDLKEGDIYEIEHINILKEEKNKIEITVPKHHGL